MFTFSSGRTIVPIMVGYVILDDVLCLVIKRFRKTRRVSSSEGAVDLLNFTFTNRQMWKREEKTSGKTRDSDRLRDGEWHNEWLRSLAR